MPFSAESVQVDYQGTARTLEPGHRKHTNIMKHSSGESTLYHKYYDDQKSHCLHRFTTHLNQLNEVLREFVIS